MTASVDGRDDPCLEAHRLVRRDREIWHWTTTHGPNGGIADTLDEARTRTMTGLWVVKTWSRIPGSAGWVGSRNPLKSPSCPTPSLGTRRTLFWFSINVSD